LATFNFFGTTTPPSTQLDDSPVTLGLLFATLEEGTITKVRFHVPTGYSGSYTGAIYNVDTTSLVVSKAFSGLSAGWNEVTFDSPVDIDVGVTYCAAVFTSGGDYSYQASYSWPATANSGDLYTASTNAGRYDYGGSLQRPTTAVATNFWVDVVFDDGAGGLETITGEGASTLAAVTSSGSGTPVITGTGSATLAAVTSSAAGTPILVGSGAQTLAAVTSTAAGTPVVSGTGAVTLAALLSAATGTPILVGTGSSTLSAVVSAGTDVVTPDSLVRTVTVSGRTAGATTLTGHGAVASRALSGSSRSGSTLRGHS
jgi:hypothetical protein